MEASQPSTNTAGGHRAARMLIKRHQTFCLTLYCRPRTSPVLSHPSVFSTVALVRLQYCRTRASPVLSHSSVYSTVAPECLQYCRTRASPVLLHSSVSSARGIQLWSHPARSGPGPKAHVASTGPTLLQQTSKLISSTTTKK